MNLQLKTGERSSQIPYEDLVRFRPELESALERTGDPTTHTFHDIVEGIEQNRFTLWCAEKSIMITEYMYYPNKKGVHVFLAGGDLQEIREVLQPKLIKWAKDEGFDHLSLCGRPGWKRALKEDGWGGELVVLTKEL